MSVTKFKVCVNLFMLLLMSVNIRCNVQVGPDPWDFESEDKLNEVKNELEVPPDLRMVPKKKVLTTNGAGAGDLFYKRLLAIMLKAGQVKKNEDGTVSVSLEMKFDKKKWQLLNGYTALNSIITEDIFRRSLGYIEEAISKPTIVEKVAVAWSEYILFYLSEYKMHITWTFGIMAFLTAAIWLWCHMSHRHIYMTLFIALYLYEIFSSYKEAEKEELTKFLSALNRCKWFSWSSDCYVPHPDPLIVIKYMNPLRIGMRMFTTVITEPIVSISDTVKVLIRGLTDGLWYPFDKIAYLLLMLNFIILLVFFLIMIVFNFILNIPINFSFLGLFNIGLKQRNRSFNTNVNESPRTERIEDTDRISGATLNRLLDVCSQAICTAQSSQNAQNLRKPKLQFSTATNSCRLRRSASTGRLPSGHDDFSRLQIENSPKLCNKATGSGDGW